MVKDYTTGPESHIRDSLQTLVDQPTLNFPASPTQLPYKGIPQQSPRYANLPKPIYRAAGPAPDYEKLARHMDSMQNLNSRSQITIQQSANSIADMTSYLPSSPALPPDTATPYRPFPSAPFQSYPSISPLIPRDSTAQFAPIEKSIGGPQQQPPIQQPQNYAQPQTVSIARPEYYHTSLTTYPSHPTLPLYGSVPSLSHLTLPLAYPKITIAYVKTAWEPVLGIDSKAMLTKGNLLQRSASNLSSLNLLKGGVGVGGGGVVGGGGGESPWKVCIVKINPVTRTLALFRMGRKGDVRELGMPVSDPELAGTPPLQTYNLRNATVEKATNIARAHRAFRIRLMNGVSVLVELGNEGAVAEWMAVVREIADAGGRGSVQRQQSMGNVQQGWSGAEVISVEGRSGGMAGEGRVVA
ncbi:hypothetical protein HDV00_004933 [Rhizophlyctis rosea]|nr:hypothetical protein HDV00_004933 [Rhizophlyctis rosea]